MGGLGRRVCFDIVKPPQRMLCASKESRLEVGVCPSSRSHETNQFIVNPFAHVPLLGAG